MRSNFDDTQMRIYGYGNFRITPHEWLIKKRNHDFVIYWDPIDYTRRLEIVYFTFTRKIWDYDCSVRIGKYKTI